MSRDKKYKNIIIIGSDNPNQSSLQDLAIKINALNKDGETLVIGDGKHNLTEEEIRLAIDPTRIDRNTNIELSGHGQNIDGEHFINILQNEPRTTRNLIKLINSLRPDLPKNIGVNSCFAGASANCIDELTPGSILLSKGPENQSVYINTASLNVLAKAEILSSEEDDSRKEYSPLALTLESFMKDTSQSCFYSVKLLNGAVKSYHVNLSIDDILSSTSIDEIYINKIRYAITDLLKEGPNLPSDLRRELTSYLEGDEINKLFNFETRKKRESDALKEKIEAEEKQRLVNQEYQRLIDLPESRALEKEMGLSRLRHEQISQELTTQKIIEQKKEIFAKSLSYIFAFSKEKPSELVKKLVPKFMPKEELYKILELSKNVENLLENAIDKNDKIFANEMANLIVEKARMNSDFDLEVGYLAKDKKLTLYFIESGILSKKETKELEKIFALKEVYFAEKKGRAALKHLIADYIADLPSASAERILKLMNDPKGFIKDNLMSWEIINYLETENKPLNNKNFSPLKRIANLNNINKSLKSIGVKIQLNASELNPSLNEQSLKSDINLIIKNHAKKVKEDTGIDLKSIKSLFSGIDIEKASNLLESKDLILYAANHNRDLFDKILALNNNKFPKNIINIISQEGAVEDLTKVLIDTISKAPTEINYYTSLLPKKLLNNLLEDPRTPTDIKELLTSTTLTSGIDTSRSQLGTSVGSAAGAAAGVVESYPAAGAGAGVSTPPAKKIIHLDDRPTHKSSDSRDAIFELLEKEKEQFASIKSGLETLRLVEDGDALPASPSTTRTTTSPHKTGPKR